jgi:hypothetical protein
VNVNVWLQNIGLCGVCVCARVCACICRCSLLQFFGMSITTYHSSKSGECVCVCACVCLCVCVCVCVCMCVCACVYVCVCLWSTFFPRVSVLTVPFSGAYACRVLQKCTHTYTRLGLARTINIRCTYGIFGREITKYMVIYGVYIQLWPTPHKTLVLCCQRYVRAHTHAHKHLNIPTQICAP